MTADWLGGVLGRDVDELSGRAGRHRPDRDLLPAPVRRATSTVLVKLPPPDPCARDMMAGAYRGEVRFYQRVASTVAVRTPACHHAEIADDSGDFVIVLEDLAPAEQGDQIAGCTADQARDAVVNLAGLHGPRWCDPTLLEVDTLSINGPEDIALLLEMYEPTNELFLDGLGDLIPAEDAATLRACGDGDRALAARAQRAVRARARRLPARQPALPARRRPRCRRRRLADPQPRAAGARPRLLPRHQPVGRGPARPRARPGRGVPRRRSRRTASRATRSRSAGTTTSSR